MLQFMYKTFLSGECNKDNIVGFKKALFTVCKFLKYGGLGVELRRSTWYANEK